ncbi:MAG: hypothetical protein JJ971_00645 [Balneolaceae bacterium]|nr:hypothetical protein [Balneolaceae bacterium]MBO6544877.1 hypothetical protein [Balneolaceae bacterium]MBO6646273.1 hypothetical protein [Balneolaceae bacterium]
MRIFLTLICLGLVLNSCNKDSSISSARDILTRVWLNSKDVHSTSFSYDAISTIYHNGKVYGSEEHFYAQQYPNGLIVKFDSLNSSNGIIFHYDSSYAYQNNKIEFSNFRPLRLWKQAFSIKFESPDETLEKVFNLGIDTTLISEDTFNNQNVYIIGATPGSLKKNQFWIDKEKLVTVRVITYLEERDFLWDVHFEDYLSLNNSWYAGTVKFYENNILTLVEEHINHQIIPTLPDTFFTPSNFGSLRW